jgi:hypothetical protein
MSAAKKLSDKKEQQENMLWEQSKEVLRLGRLYGLLDGTICTSKEQAVASNQELVKDYGNGH